MCLFSAMTFAGLGVSYGVANAIAIAANAAAALSMVGSAVGGVTGAVSAQQQGKAAEAEYKYKANMEKENAKIAQENANRERQQGIEESRLQRLKAAQNVASQTSAMAASGIDVTQGTAVDLLGDTAMWGEMDALNTLANSESRAQAYEAQANNFKNQSRLDSLAGQNAYKAGQLNAITTGLNGISNTMSVADKWYGFSNNLASGTKAASTKSSGTKYAMNTLNQFT